MLKFESVILCNCHSVEQAVLNYYVRLSSVSKKLRKRCTRLIILYYCSYLHRCFYVILLSHNKKTLTKNVLWLRLKLWYCKFWGITHWSILQSTKSSRQSSVRPVEGSCKVSEKIAHPEISWHPPILLYVLTWINLENSHILRRSSLQHQSSSLLFSRKFEETPHLFGDCRRVGLFVTV